MNGECPVCGEISVDRKYHFRKNPDHKPGEWDTCDQCEERYKSLSHHWGNTSNSCEYLDDNTQMIQCANPECSKSYRTYSSIQSHYDYNPDHKPENWSKCPTCRERFKKLSDHWGGDCPYPEFNKRHLDIITGSLMGDGNIQHEKETPVFRIEGFTEPEYLHYLDSIFGTLGRGVKDGRTAEESYEHCGFDNKSDPSEYKDKYRWSTRSHPTLERFSQWYSTGEKIWPEDINMTPTVLRHWYVTDGSRKAKQIRISASNEIGNEDKIVSYFRDSDLPLPHFEYAERGRGGQKMDVLWDTQDSVKLFEYMGRPVPGFEYKWINYSNISRLKKSSWDEY